MFNKYLFIGEYGLFAGGISLMTISNILSIICLGCSAIMGFINLGIYIKKAFGDKNIDEEEKTEIKKQAEEIKENIKEINEMIDNWGDKNGKTN